MRYIFYILLSTLLLVLPDPGFAQTPEKVDKIINNGYEKYYPMISGDGTTLYYKEKRGESFMFMYSTLNKEGKWGVPRQIYELKEKAKLDTFFGLSAKCRVESSLFRPKNMQF